MTECSMYMLLMRESHSPEHRFLSDKRLYSIVNRNTCKKCAVAWTGCTTFKFDSMAYNV